MLCFDSVRGRFKTLLRDCLHIFRHVTRVCTCIAHWLFIFVRKSSCYIISHLITCTCFVYIRESANACAFFSLHPLITGNTRYVHNEKRVLPTSALLSGYLLIFWVVKKGRSMHQWSLQMKKEYKRVLFAFLFTFFNIRLYSQLASSLFLLLLWSLRTLFRK
jgi:hypothetical protein